MTIEMVMNFIGALNWASLQFSVILLINGMYTPHICNLYSKFIRIIINISIEIHCDRQEEWITKFKLMLFHVGITNAQTLFIYISILIYSHIIIHSGSEPFVYSAISRYRICLKNSDGFSMRHCYEFVDRKFVLPHLGDSGDRPMIYMLFGSHIGGNFLFTIMGFDEYI